MIYCCDTSIQAMGYQRVPQKNLVLCEVTAMRARSKLDVWSQPITR
jgi:hypothetical protein